MYQHQQTCPTCGSCPTCGRRAQQQFYPYWHYGGTWPYAAGNLGIASGGLTVGQQTITTNTGE